MNLWSPRFKVFTAVVTVIAVALIPVTSVSFWWFATGELAWAGIILACMYMWADRLTDWFKWEAKNKL